MMDESPSLASIESDSWFGYGLDGVGAIDPGVFVRELLFLDPTEQQVRLFNALRAGEKRIAVRSGHGVGKTTTLAGILLWYLLTRPNCLIVCTAAKEEQLKTQLWGEVRGHLARGVTDFQGAVEVDLTKIYRKSNPKGAQALIQVARRDNPDALQGYHHDHLLLLVDEASGIPDKNYEPLEGMLTKEDNIAILTGNPTRASGFFHDCFKKYRADWDCHHLNGEESPIVSQVYVDKMVRYGKDSNVYRVRVLGEFPKSDDDSLIPLEMVEASMERGIKYPLALALEEYWSVIQDEANKGENIEDLYLPFIVGVDPGRSLDGDATGLVARWGDYLIDMEEHWFRDLNRVAGQAIVFRDRIAQETGLPFSHFAVDTIGLGAGVYDNLIAGGHEAKDVNVSGSPTPDGKYRMLGIEARPRNLRAELCLAVRKWLDEDACLPVDHSLLDEFLSEVTGPKYTLDAQGRLLIESKDAMKKRGVASPNLLDGTALTFAKGGSGGGLCFDSA